MKLLKVKIGATSADTKTIDNFTAKSIMLLYNITIRLGVHHFLV